MTDQMSNLAYQSLKESGKLGKAQAHYLSVFMYGDPLTHAEATSMVAVKYGKNYPPRNGRVSELEKMGFLKKAGTNNGKHGQKVNLWIWTRRTEPLPMEGAWIKCCHCDGRGGKYGDVPVSAKQGDFLK